MKALTSATSIAAMLVAFAFAGCNSNSEQDYVEAPESTPKTVEEHEHHHPEHGPNGGDLIELGSEEFHAELLHPEKEDHEGEKKEARDEVVTIRIYDGEVKNAVPTDVAEVTINVKHDGEPEQFKLPAMPEESDPDGKSSRFTTDDAELIEHLQEGHAEVVLVVMINGKSYRGELDHGHSHGHDHTQEGEKAHSHE